MQAELDDFLPACVDGVGTPFAIDNETVQFVLGLVGGLLEVIGVLHLDVAVAFRRVGGGGVEGQVAEPVDMVF